VGGDSYNPMALAAMVVVKGRRARDRSMQGGEGLRGREMECFLEREI